MFSQVWKDLVGKDIFVGGQHFITSYDAYQARDVQIERYYMCSWAGAHQ